MSAALIGCVRYNQKRRHIGIGLMPADQVHYGQTAKLPAARQKTLDYAFRANLSRSINKAPEPPQKPTAVWINPPAQKHHAQA
jgi:putative transposase